MPKATAVKRPLFLEQTRPDVLLHFGDSPVWKTLVAEAKTRDIPVVFWLYDRSCTDRTALWLADYVIVPSESDRQHYWQTLGLACFAIPNGTEAGHAHREFFGNIFVQPGLPYIPVPIRGPADRSTGLRRTYVVCPAIEHPAGGVKKLDDLVDLLNVQGFPAAIVHPLRGFRCTWFENQTPVCQLSQVTFAPDDLVVLPETLGPRAADIAPTARKLIFNQNSYYTFADYSSDPKELTTPYTRNDALGVMVVSEDSENYLRHAFPEIRVYRYRYGIDPGLFSPRFPKQKKLCYMPRKNVGDALQVINLLKFRGALEGWTVQPIDGMSPPQVAEVMRQSAFFLSFGHPEGFGLPPAEAMACGWRCGRLPWPRRARVFPAGVPYPIEMGDILGFAQTLENLLREFDRSPEGLETAGRRAAEFIHSYCPLEQEASRVAEIWTELQGMMRRRHVHHFGDLVVNDFREFSGLSTATIEENINRHSELVRGMAVAGGGRVRRQGRAVLRPLAKLHLRSAQFELSQGGGRRKAQRHAPEDSSEHQDPCRPPVSGVWGRGWGDVPVGPRMGKRGDLRGSARPSRRLRGLAIPTARMADLPAPYRAARSVS